MGVISWFKGLFGHRKADNTAYVPPGASSGQMSDQDALTTAGMVSSKDFVQLVRKTIAKLPGAEQNKIRDSLVVNLLNDGGIEDYGRQVKDTVNPDGLKAGYRPQIDVAPFNKPVGGAFAIVTFIDKNDELNVLLAYKDDEKRLSLPGGHMQPANRDPIIQIQDSVTPEGDPAVRLVKNRIDQDLKDTARNELREETGLHIPEHVEFIPLLPNSKLGTNSVQTHAITQPFLVHLGKLDEPPPLTARDDIDGAVWVKRSDLLPENEKLGVQKFASKVSRYNVRLPNGNVMPITDYHGQEIYNLFDNGIRGLSEAQQRVENEILSAASKPTFASSIQKPQETWSAQEAEKIANQTQLAAGRT